MSFVLFVTLSFNKRKTPIKERKPFFPLYIQYFHVPDSVYKGTKVPP